MTASQRKAIVLDPGQRYRPLKKARRPHVHRAPASLTQRPSVGAQLLQGVVMLADTKSGEPEKIYQPKAPKIGVPGVSDDEPAPPEPFECSR